ncbi:MAG: DUF302 domain-containing protein [Proteiniphilum sp.]|nr:DUF302 domain-containing protein [Proteiniphilum sp.]MDD3909131.1 DUF302 domain-containing protein [Proteiniphilum sp.]MDD4416084.1 DUF302 domain-containing protein [Proteiniphilum sp.]
MEQIFFESRSRYGFEETVDRLSKIIAESGWKVIHIHDLQETMRKNGKDIVPVKVVELCKPDYAYRLLSDDPLRAYSNLMPCRIAVYEKDDGSTYVSRMNPAILASHIEGAVLDVMSGAYSDAEKFVEKIVKE